jgi:hypothetical protein
MEQEVMLAELDNLPEVEYPEEVVDHWEKQAEIARFKLAIGELVPKTAAQMAAERGIRI